MSEFIDLLERYQGFGQSSHLDLDEIRLLYYGRPSIFVSFTDDGEYDLKPTNLVDMDRPDSILCYDVRDVVGRKVRSGAFYANIFRPIVDKRSIKNIKQYSKQDFKIDSLILTEKYGHLESWGLLKSQYIDSIRFKSEFTRLWELTSALAYEIGGDHGKVWNFILRDELKYGMISDPTGSGVFVSGRTPATLIIDYNNRIDMDILPIQKYRIDPRRHTREMVERKVRKLAGSRNRIAKRRKSGKGIFDL